ncbi:MAG: hypothetical protein GY942_20260 [Aestuariibacter sp.]|nr:hypothetical protein [Aestuariibacter sp.]
MTAYYKRLTGDDKAAQIECALAFARIECHYFINCVYFYPDQRTGHHA